jgi:hypothetical protein
MSQGDTAFVLNAGLLAFIAGSVALGAMSMGHEYSYRALPGLLTQPISRMRLLATKSAVLALLLASLWALALWQFDNHLMRDGRINMTFVLLPFGSLLLTPWLTMVSRGPLAGAVFSIAVPLAIYVMSVQTYHRAADAMNSATWATVTLIAFGGLLTWRSFLRLEAIDGPHAEIGVPAWMRRPVPPAEWSSLRSVRAGNPLWQLLRKELHLQQVTIVVAGQYLLLWAVTATARSAVPGFVGISFDVMTMLYTAVVSLMAGAVASAEERQLGTSEWQTLMPLAAWKQWTLKVGVAFALALTLGLVMPLVLSAVPPKVETLPFDEEWAFAIMIICAGALYVSSLNSSGMRAFLATFPAIAGAALVGAIVLGPLSLGAAAILQPLARNISIFHNFSFGLMSQIMTLGVLLPTGAGFGLVLLRFAGRNHQSADRSVARIRHQVLWMLAYAIIAILVWAFANAVLEAGLRPIPR